MAVSGCGYGRQDDRKAGYGYNLKMFVTLSMKKFPLATKLKTNKISTMKIIFLLAMKIWISHLEKKLAEMTEMPNEL